MAKVRVYELAKELNMDSKSLVDKLVSAGMDVKNYMSALDEDATKKAKEIASGAISEVIEEKRIKPTVIRRRKKIQIKHDIAESAAEHIVEEIPTAVTEAEKVVKLKEKDAEDVFPEAPAQAVAEEKAPSAEEPEKEEVQVEEVKPEAVEAQAHETPKEEKPKQKKAKRKKTEAPAKIIRRVEVSVEKEVPMREPEKKTKRPSRPKAKEAERFEPKIPLEMEEEDVSKSGKRGRKQGKKGGKSKEDREFTPRGVVRHQRKAIYERADLYEGRGGRPKRKAGGKKAKEDLRKGRSTEITVPKAIKRRIKVQEFVTIFELAKAMGIKAIEVVQALMKQGVVANINKSIDFETASVVADDFGYELELDTFEERYILAEEEDRPEDMAHRPPVVTIMGHVDHGKTSLLDYIRKSNIIGGESGGITQHIGAYYVKTEEGDIVFLDTPGHEAFTAMRARGAEVTDIIVLVVAADDGVMPQTKEAINHARAADIPIVLAINKIDKPGANPDKVKRELAEVEIATEDWGGDTISGNISAKTGEGVDDLLKLILLQAEMLELKANPNKPARGVVIEAKLDKNKGSVATVLIDNGTLRTGDLFVCGEYYGRVRAMLDHRGRKMKFAGPSFPVELYGISGVPMAGDKFVVVKDEKKAKQIVEYRKVNARKERAAKRGIVSLDELFERIKEGEVKELNIILKTDVQGSLEALTESLVKQSTEEVKLKIVHSATGAITESDVMLASASDAIIIGFNVRANLRVSEIAEREKVDIRYYDVIYNVIKEIRLAMAGLLEPVYEETVIGRADIKEIFRVPKIGAVAGCQVTDGRIERNAHVRLLRDDVVIFDGKIASLRRFKDDVKEVQSGYECGVGLENYSDIKPGDAFEVYQITEVEVEL